ncbi:MAG: DUF4124 domain-containing protein [Gammaproteobacteria bacterium]
MKLLFYSLVIIIVITIGLYLIKPQLFQAIRNKITNELSTIIPPDTLQTKTTVYEWKNSKGELQFTNTPPPPGIKYTSKLVPNGTNIMPSSVFTGNSEKE